MSPTETARRLERLTPEQAALLPVVRDEWLGHGLRVGPADRASAEAGVRQAYAAAGLPAPGLVVWLRSPLEGAVGAALLASGGHVLAQVREQVREQVWDQVRDQVVVQALAQVRDQVRDQVLAEVRAQVGDQVWRACYGQHDAGWLSFYAAMSRVTVLDTSRLDGLMQVARAAGWWWPFRHTAILTERPVTLHRDDRGRLHHPHEAAARYPDGWGVYAWHGARVPAHVIEHPEEITAEEITAESNAEVRRVMLSRYGESRYLEAIGARPVHRDETGELYRADVPGDEPLVMVRVINATPESDLGRKPYWLRVPPTMQRAREAVAWTAGTTEAEYVVRRQS